MNKVIVLKADGLPGRKEEISFNFTSIMSCWEITKESGEMEFGVHTAYHGSHLINETEYCEIFDIFVSPNCPKPEWM